MEICNGKSNRKCTIRDLWDMGYMPLCCHLVGSRSLIAESKNECSGGYE